MFLKGAPAFFKVGVLNLLFGTKWDMSIVLFQLLLIKGIFTVLTGLYSNYLLSLGRAKTIFVLETVKDGCSLIALLISLPFMTILSDGDIVYGIKIMLAGQIVAALVSCAVSLIVAAKASKQSSLQFVVHLLPYLVITLLALAAAYPACTITSNPWLLAAVQSIVLIGVYVLVNSLLHSALQKEVLSYIFKKSERSVV